jgi:hypothetical protein
MGHGGVLTSVGFDSGMRFLLRVCGTSTSLLKG